PPGRGEREDHEDDGVPANRSRERARYHANERERQGGEREPQLHGVAEAEQERAAGQDVPVCRRRAVGVEVAHRADAWAGKYSAQRRSTSRTISSDTLRGRG